MGALRSVMDPDLGPGEGQNSGHDLVSLGRVRQIEVLPEGGVRVLIAISTPTYAHQERLTQEVRRAVTQLPGVTEVQVQFQTQTRRAERQLSPTAQEIPGVAHIIAVSSGKGGVGKSTVAVNLATALALEGARVGLMDVDVYGPNVPMMMGVTEEPRLIQDPERGEMFVPPISHGVKVMSMGFLVQVDEALIWRGPQLHNVVNQFCRKVSWGELDYLVVDMPPGTGDVQLSLAQLVPVTGAVLVTTPQEVSLHDVRKAHSMFEKVRVPVLGLVENMSYFKCDGCEKKHSLFGADGGKVLAKRLRLDLLAQLPMVPIVREGGDEGRPIVLRDPSSEVAIAFRELARKVTGQVSRLVHEGVDPSQIVQIGKFS